MAQMLGLLLLVALGNFTADDDLKCWVGEVPDRFFLFPRLPAYHMIIAALAARDRT